MKEEKTTTLYYLAVIFVIGCVFGYGIKSYSKGRIASGPDDRKVTVYTSSYDLEGAKKRLDEEMKKAEEAAQAQQLQGDTGSGQQAAPAPGCAAPAPTAAPAGGTPQGCAVPQQ